MELNTIKNSDKWGNSTARLNENFSKISTEVDKMKYAAYNSKLYPSLAALQEEIPSPEVGDWAIVGDTIPGDIYRCEVSGEWKATGEQGGGFAMEVVEKHVTENYSNVFNNPVSVVNNPDNEDIQSVGEVGKEVIQFADKQYNHSNFSGLGRIYLRKNISDGKNLLVQTMLPSASTIYIIQYDYDLNGATINIPSNCVLNFQGGSLKNGKIVGDNTVIKADLEQIFHTDMSFGGTFKIRKSYPEWFGAIADGVHDNISQLRKALELNYHMQLQAGTYLVSEPLKVDIRIKIEGEVEKTVIAPTDGTTLECVIDAQSTVSVSYGFIRNIMIDGKNLARYGLKCAYISTGTVVENLNIVNCTEAGLSLTKSWYAVFRNIRSWSNKHGMYIYGEKTGDDYSGEINGTQFENLWLNHNTGCALYVSGKFGYAIMLNSCTFENSAGIAEVLLENIAGAVTLLNCYTEGGARPAVKVTPAYNNTGTVTCIGGIYCNAGAEQFNVGKITNLNLLGSHLVQFSSPSDYNVVSEAGSNYIMIDTSGGVEANVSTLKCTNYAFGTPVKDWSNPDTTRTASRVTSANMGLLGWKGYQQSPDIKFDFGSAKEEAVENGYCYRMRLTYSLDNGILINSVHRGADGDTVTQRGSMGPYQFKYSKIVASNLLDFPYKTSVPSSGDLGGSIFYTGQNRPLFYTGQRWVDATGSAYNAAKSGPTSSRPSNVAAGFMYKDTTLGKWVVWNGSSWDEL